MRTSPRLLSVLLAGACGALGASASIAADFRSISERAAVFYDAPSVQSKKLFVANQSYPVEIIVSIDNWVKVRDASGGLAWVEKRVLSERRTLLVKSATADVRQSPEEAAPLVFQAREGVV